MSRQDSFEFTFALLSGLSERMFFW